MQYWPKTKIRNACLCGNIVNPHIQTYIKCPKCKLKIHKRCYFIKEEEKTSRYGEHCMKCRIDLIEPFTKNNTIWPFTLVHLIDGVQIQSITLKFYEKEIQAIRSGTMNVVLGLVNPQKEPNCMFEMNALSYKLTFSVENNRAYKVMMLTKEEKMVRWLYLNPFIQHKEIELTIECHDVNKTQAIGIFLLDEIYEAQELIENVKQKKVLPEIQERIKKLLHEQLEFEATNMMSNTKYCLSLKCPLTFKPIDIPVRGINCEHPNCMDLHNYIQNNKQTGQWKCLVCHEQCYYRELYTDEYNIFLLKKYGNLSNGKVYLSLNESGEIVDSAGALEGSGWSNSSKNNSNENSNSNKKSNGIIVDIERGNFPVKIKKEGSSEISTIAMYSYKKGRTMGALEAILAPQLPTTGLHMANPNIGESIPMITTPEGELSAQHKPQHNTCYTSKQFDQSNIQYAQIVTQQLNLPENRRWCSQFKTALIQKTKIISYSLQQISQLIIHRITLPCYQKLLEEPQNHCSIKILEKLAKLMQNEQQLMAVLSVWYPSLDDIVKLTMIISRDELKGEEDHVKHLFGIELLLKLVYFFYTNERTKVKIFEYLLGEALMIYCKQVKFDSNCLLCGKVLYMVTRVFPTLKFPSKGEFIDTIPHFKKDHKKYYFYLLQFYTGFFNQLPRTLFSQIFTLILVPPNHRLEKEELELFWHIEISFFKELFKLLLFDVQAKGRFAEIYDCEGWFRQALYDRGGKDALACYGFRLEKLGEGTARFVLNTVGHQNNCNRGMLEGLIN